MLVSKQTYCFFCANPTWVSGRFAQTNGWLEKRDQCSTCGASKLTDASVGIIDYYDPQSRPGNFMTNDPRRRLRL